MQLIHLVSLITFECLIYRGICYPQAVHPLPLAVQSLSGHSAVISMSDITLPPSGKCSVTYHQANSTEVSVKLDYTPQLHNYTIELNQLEPSTVYDMYLMCEENGTKYQSTRITFMTVEEGKTKNMTDDNTQVTSSESPEDSHDEIPEIQKQCVDDNLNPVDVAVGIVFGTLGVGIVGAVFYYLAKKIHHRQRMQRFHQYRQHQNDPFAAVETDESSPPLT